MTIQFKRCFAGLGILLSMGVWGELRAQEDQFQTFRTLLDQEKYDDAALLVPKLQDLIKSRPQFGIALVQTIVNARETLPPPLAASISNMIFNHRPWDAGDAHLKVMDDLFAKMMGIDADDVKRLYYDTIWASGKSSYFALADQFFMKLRAVAEPDITLYNESINAMDKVAQIEGTAYASRAASHIILLAGWMEFTKAGSSDVVASRIDDLCKTYVDNVFKWKTAPGSWRQANDIAWNCAVWDVARKRHDAAHERFSALENWKPVLSDPSALPIYDYRAIGSEKRELVDPIFILYFKPKGKKRSLRYDTRKLGHFADQSLAECQKADGNVLTCFFARMDGYSSAEIKLRLGTFPDQSTAVRENLRLAANRKLSEKIKALRLEVKAANVDGQSFWVIETDYALTLEQATKSAQTITQHYEYLRPQVIAPKAY